jgi:uncharacterized cupin superfamily protein
MPKITPANHPVIAGSGYLPPHDRAVAGRSRIDIAAAGRLGQFGANLVTLMPGAWSSQRHWHSHEDELIVVLSGSLVLVEDGGETQMHPGDIATFKAGIPIGHHLQNRGSEAATLLAIGTDLPDLDECRYPDIDMQYSPATGFTRKPARR